MKKPPVWLMILCAALVITSCTSLSAQGKPPLAVPSSTMAPTETRRATTATSIPPSVTPVKTATPTRTKTASPTFTATATPSGVFQAAGEAIAPILLYHRVTDQTGSYRYAVKVDNFRTQMKYLANQGYKTVTISDLADVIRNGGYLPEKTFVLTFDDGFLDVYENAFPILQEYGFFATVFLISGVIETDQSYGYMQPEQIAQLVAAGWEVGSHSVSHSELTTSKLGMGTEITLSRTELEEKLGVTVRTFAYPYASANAWVQGQVKEQGYESAVGVGIFNRHTTRSLYFLSRREVYHNTSLTEFQEMLALPPTPTATPESTSQTRP